MSSSEEFKITDRQWCIVGMIVIIGILYIGFDSPKEFFDGCKACKAQRTLAI